MKIMRGLHLLLPLHQPNPHSPSQGHQAQPPRHLILMCLKKDFRKESGKHCRSLQELSEVGVGLPLLQQTKTIRGTIKRRRIPSLTHPGSCHPGPQAPPLIRQHHGLPSPCSSCFSVRLWSGQLLTIQIPMLLRE